MLDIQRSGTFGSVLAPRVRDLPFCLTGELLDHERIEHGSDDA